MYDVKKTILKGLKVFVYAGVPAGLLALVVHPDFVLLAPVFGALLTGVENYLKNKDY